MLITRLNLLALIALLVIPWISGTSIAKPNPKDLFGVLVQVDAQSSTNTHEFKALTSKHKLKPTDWFKHLNTIALKTIKEKDSPRSEQDWNQVCGEFLKIPGVRLCELDRKLKVNWADGAGVSCHQTSGKEPAADFARELLPYLQTCSLLQNVSENNSMELPPHGKKDLSAFWAQEYTGADLLRKDLEAEMKGIPLPPDLYAVWDSDDDDHGTQVSNLIGGPHSSSLLPTDKTKDHLRIHSTQDYVTASESATETCLDKKLCPRVVNNSMGWVQSELIKQSVERVVDQGAVFVVAAGNESSPVSKIDPQQQ